MKKKCTSIFVIALLTIFTSCVETYDLQTTNFEDAIVVEATITNELKQQEVKITRTYRLEQNTPPIVSNAQVTVTSNLGTTYQFFEQNGVYKSVLPFQALPNITYQLKIVTPDGKSYSSSNETLTAVNPIQSVVPTVITKYGVTGVDMVVNSFDPNSKSKYYRYEYEETYKIIAPKWSPVEGIVTNYPGTITAPGTLTLSPRTTEARICFTTKKSTDILLTNTTNQSEDRVAFPVRFVANTDYVIANRYSIIVKQYIQNLASYTFYKTLKELSGSGGILSQNQPGFFRGNISNDSDNKEKVLGYFDVSSVSSKRIFFNFQDVFPNTPAPRYPFKCPEISLENESEYILKYCFSQYTTPGTPTCSGDRILSGLYYRTNVYYDGAISYGSFITIYPVQCGDCTSFASNIRPLFWID